MKILLVSDTHGALTLLETIINKESPDHVLHMGDIGFDEHWLPSVVFVKGNNDDGVQQLKERELNYCHKKIYMTHGDLYEREVMQRIKEKYGKNTFEFKECMQMFEDVMLEAGLKKHADIVCFGHTHYAVAKRRKGILLINPGSLLFSSDGKNVTYAVLTLEDDHQDVEIKYIDNSM